MLVFYDEDCGFCRWSASVLARWDRRRRLRFVSIRSDEGARRLAPIGTADRDGSWHVITWEGCITSAGAAVPVVLRELPGARPLARAAETFPRTTERAYRAVARRRASLGGLLRVEACRVPTDR